MGTLTSWNPLGHSRPVTGLLVIRLSVIRNKTLTVGGEQWSNTFGIIISDTEEELFYPGFWM
jgi:hypothetical protein